MLIYPKSEQMFVFYANILGVWACKKGKIWQNEFAFGRGVERNKKVGEARGLESGTNERKKERERKTIILFEKVWKEAR